MRKLLVVSQKGGIGKTTTAINLAAATAQAGARVLLLDVDPLSSISLSLNLTEHPRRQSLRTAGIDLPGVLVSSVVPGLDVLSPYDDGGCADQELDDVLKVLANPEVPETYGCLIVNTPPFLGANAAQMLAAADEFLLVMRAEPMAYRTLPAFLELIQRSKRDSRAEMKGMILTLPEGEQPGGRWERELRGRFGSRILPQVVPFDDEVAKAGMFGQVAATSAPDAPAARAYHSLVAHLELAAGANPEQQRAESPLLAVATAMRSEGSFARHSGRKSQVLVAVPAGPGEDSPSYDADVDDAVSHGGNAELVFRSLPEMDLDDELVIPTLPKAPARRSTALLKLPPVGNAPAPVPLLPAAHAGLTTRSLLVAVGLAIVLGVGLRFMTLPESLLPHVLPIGVGVIVTAGIVLVLRLILLAEGAEVASAAGPPTKGRPGTAKAPSAQFKKLPPRPESKQDPNTRLANLARQRRGGKP